MDALEVQEPLSMPPPNFMVQGCTNDLLTLQWEMRTCWHSVRVRLSSRQTESPPEESLWSHKKAHKDRTVRAQNGCQRRGIRVQQAQSTWHPLCLWARGLPGAGVKGGSDVPTRAPVLQRTQGRAGVSGPSPLRVLPAWYRAATNAGSAILSPFLRGSPNSGPHLQWVKMKNLTHDTRKRRVYSTVLPS